MFTVQPLCKAIILSVSLLLILLINILSRDSLLNFLSIIFFIWLWRVFSSLKIYVTGNNLVKQTGKTFKRKTIILLKNISQIYVFNVHEYLPAFIRVYSYNQSIIILGLNGRQRQLLEKTVLQLK